MEIRETILVTHSNIVFDNILVDATVALKEVTFHTYTIMYYVYNGITRRLGYCLILEGFILILNDNEKLPKA